MSDSIRKTRIVPATWICLTLAAAALAVSGCGISNKTNSAVVDLYLESFSAPSSNFKLCIQSVRFKADATSTSHSLVSINKEITLDPAGMDIDGISVPEGTYTRIEFDLDTSCAGGVTADVQNLNGSFVSIENIVPYFDGNFSYAGGNQVLRLNAQPIIDALRSANSNPGIKNNAEAATGTF